MSLQELRRASEMTQVKMAKSLGVAQKQISDREAHRRAHLYAAPIDRSNGRQAVLVAELPDRKPVVLYRHHRIGCLGMLDLLMSPQ